VYNCLADAGRILGIPLKNTGHLWTQTIPGTKTILYFIYFSIISKLISNTFRDFIDIYLLEMRKGTKNFDQEQLELVCLDLFKVRAFLSGYVQG